MDYSTINSYALKAALSKCTKKNQTLSLKPPNFTTFPKYYLKYNNKKKTTKKDKQCGTNHDKHCLDLSNLNGISCRNVNCTYFQCYPSNKPPLWHEECLISFINGDIRVCKWCCIQMHIDSYKFTPTEYFATHFDPNVEYVPHQYFEIAKDQINNEIITEPQKKKMKLNNVYSFDDKSSKHLIIDKYCLLKSTGSKHRIYYLLKYKNANDLFGSSAHLISQKFNQETVNFLNKSKLIDNIYQYQYYDPVDETQKEIEVLIKTRNNGYSNNVILFRNVWPLLLQQKCAQMTINELFNITLNDIRKWMKKHPKELPDKWCNENSTFRMLFGNHHYKINDLRLHINKKDKIAKSNVYKVFDIGKDKFQDPKYIEIDKKIEYWYDKILNPLIQQIAKDIPEMNHWIGLKAIWPGMKELLLYHIDASRHVDTPNLFNPQVNNPSDGLFVIAHNFVNATIDDRYPHGFKNGDKPKSFCVSTLPLNIHGCHQKGRLLNHHYENIQAGDVFVVGKDAAYFVPHKTEGCNNGETSLTMSRNYRISCHS